MTKDENLLINNFKKRICEEGFSTDALIELMQTCIEYLNPLSITEYKDKYGLSYNGVKKCRKKVVILRKKYVIDND